MKSALLVCCHLLLRGAWQSLTPQ